MPQALSHTPIETFGYRDEAKVAEMTGGYFDLGHWGVVSVTGEDALDFLQRMSTVDLKKLTPGSVAHGAFLTGKGTVISLGMMFYWQDRYLMIVPPGNGETLAGHLEKFHFGEKLEVKDESAQWSLLGLWLHENTPHFLAPDKAMSTTEFRGAILWEDDFREALDYLLIPRSALSQWKAELATDGLKELGGKLFEFLRLSAGVPQVGVELGESEIILEGNFDVAVARMKGCYPGQEVVERIFTYGRVNKKLLRAQLEWPSDSLPVLPLHFEVDGKTMVTVASFVEHPFKHGEGIALAFVNKNYWDYQGKFSSQNGVTLELKKA